MLVGLAMLGAGCGYFSNGTWEDDPKNFKRAWGVPKPADVQMVHSWYWRSPHWTREEAYFFEFRKHDAFFQGFVSANSLERVFPTPTDLLQRFTFAPPAWFLPKPLDAYETWSAKRCDAWLLRDKATGEIFIYACQL
jgi:hypothetical protein